MRERRVLCPELSAVQGNEQAAWGGPGGLLGGIEN